MDITTGLTTRLLCDERGSREWNIVTIILVRHLVGKHLCKIHRNSSSELQVKALDAIGAHHRSTFGLFLDKITTIAGDLPREIRRNTEHHPSSAGLIVALPESIRIYQLHPHAYYSILIEDTNLRR